MMYELRPSLKRHSDGNMMSSVQPNSFRSSISHSRAKSVAGRVLSIAFIPFPWTGGGVMSDPGRRCLRLSSSSFQYDRRSMLFGEPHEKDTLDCSPSGTTFAHHLRTGAPSKCLCCDRAKWPSNRTGRSRPNRSLFRNPSNHRPNISAYSRSAARWIMRARSSSLASLKKSQVLQGRLSLGGTWSNGGHGSVMVSARFSSADRRACTRRNSSTDKFSLPTLIPAVSVVTARPMASAVRATSVRLIGSGFNLAWPFAARANVQASSRTAS